MEPRSRVQLLSNVQYRSYNSWLHLAAREAGKCSLMVKVSEPDEFFTQMQVLMLLLVYKIIEMISKTTGDRRGVLGLLFIVQKKIPLSSGVF